SLFVSRAGISSTGTGFLFCRVERMPSRQGEKSSAGQLTLRGGRGYSVEKTRLPFSPTDRWGVSTLEDPSMHFPSRRDFLRDSALLSAALAGVSGATAVLADETRKVKSENDKLHVACIGVRGQGKGHVAGY